MLHDLLESKRAEIIARAREKAAARTVPRATEAELARGLPLFVGHLIEIVARSNDPGDERSAIPTNHGNEILRLGLDVSQVVHGYGDVCQAVIELVDEQNARITVAELHALNRCLDDATGKALIECMRVRELSQAHRATERIGHFAHELRNRLGTAMLSFDILKKGAVTVSGGTGALLERSLNGLNHLIDRSLAEVRLESTAQRRETFLLAEFVEELETGAVMEAQARGHQLTVEPVERGVVVDADRQLLAAAVSNLLQNAFKFTQHPGQVWLRTHATADLVFIDVEDQCGGLPPGKAEALFRPFQQRSADRSGLGLGLSASRKAAQLNGGEVRVRDLPGKGCIFSVELPRKIEPHA